MQQVGLTEVLNRLPGLQPSWHMLLPPATDALTHAPGQPLQKLVLLLLLHEVPLVAEVVAFQQSVIHPIPTS